VKAPAFWAAGQGGWQAALLAPAAALVSAVATRRARRPRPRVGVPVLCCGNATVGGSGKTPLVLDLAPRLAARGLAPHALSRGHGGRLRGPLRVDPARHTAAEVGDEPLLLAERLPCWIGADRAASARAAIAAGARSLLLDDGLQSPTLGFTRAFLVIDGGAGFGNGRVLPAGPLREALPLAAARADAAVLIGEDETGALDHLPPRLPVLRARRIPGPEARALAGQRVFAFAGIGRPENVFAMLRGLGVDLAGAVSFADHHPYTDADLARLHAAAAGARLVTTRKDWMRLPPACRAHIQALDVTLAWQDESALEALLP
jgi:tetraacyldisaccharide 4'-kinase